MSHSIPIMIVDDEEWIRSTVREIFTPRGIPVVEADGGPACLQHLRNGFRGVILMDIMMPRMNGWETIREIERESLLSGNLIVMLTALEAPDDQMEGLQEMVFDYITKPFDPDDLVATVSHYRECLSPTDGEPHGA
ncbi:MAG: response regulator [Desulfuromonadia bacterium]